MFRLFAFISAVIVCLSACTPREPPGLPLNTLEQSLRLLAEPLAASQDNDWLKTHQETGQTFADYWKVKPLRKPKDQRTIYIVLLGDFSPQQRSILETTQQYLTVFYQTPVKIHRELPLDIIPDHARRIHPDWGTHQISTRYVLDELLKPERPDDALAYLCFTSSDLFSSATYNYVLGEAQTWERLGVWSIYRNGDLSEGNTAESDAAFRQCLRRTMHIATHETGHILALKHCTAHACNMNGANSVSETDRHPLHFCPICLRKLLWNLELDPAAYLSSLEQFCHEHQFNDDAQWYSRARKLIEK
jgi:archaemetzincin